MSVLDTIIARKRRELAEDQAILPWLDLAPLAENAPPPLDAQKALRRSDGAIAAISEIKRASPSAGWIRPDVEPEWVAERYVACGASAISVLTDEVFFGGHNSFLPRVRKVANVPLLRKDFVIDEYQIYHARSLGADFILLIVAALAPDVLSRLMATSAKLGMAALVEVHDAEEMSIAVDVGATLIGVNHRNLKTMKVDLSLGEQLIPQMPRDAIAVAESGIASHADVARMQALGFHAVLVGESLMRQPDPGVALRELLGGPQA